MALEFEEKDCQRYIKCVLSECLYWLKNSSNEEKNILHWQTQNFYSKY